jgi:hypothetical protein
LTTNTITLAAEGSMLQDHQMARLIATSSITAQVSQGVELMHIYHQQNEGEKINGAGKLQIPSKVDAQSADRKQYINVQSALIASLTVIKLGCVIQSLVNCAFLNT